MKLYLTWAEIHKDACALAQVLPKDKKWKGLIAITRGGLVPATIIAHALNIREIKTICATSYDDTTHAQGGLTISSDLNIDPKEDWLVIDDLADTGETLKAVRQSFPNAYYAVLYAKAQGKSLVDDYIRELDAWVVFPWEEAAV